MAARFMDLLHRHPSRHWTTSTTKPCVWPQRHLGHHQWWASMQRMVSLLSFSGVTNSACRCTYSYLECLAPLLILLWPQPTPIISLWITRTLHLLVTEPEISCIVLTRKVQKSCPRASMSLHCTLWNRLLCARICSPLGKQRCLPQLSEQSSWLTWPPTTQQLSPRTPDGTKSATGVEFAAVFPGKIISGKLQSTSSIFTVELRAILPAVTYTCTSCLWCVQTRRVLWSLSWTPSYFTPSCEKYTHRWLQMLSHGGKKDCFLLLCPWTLGVTYFSTLQRLLCSFFGELTTTMALGVEGHRCEQSEGYQKLCLSVEHFLSCWSLAGENPCQSAN